MLGVRTNIPFLIALLEHPRFVDGEIDTGFLDREGDQVRAAMPADPPLAGLAAAAAHRAQARRALAVSPGSESPRAVAADPFV